MISLALLAAVLFDAAAFAQTTAALNALGPHPFGSPRNQAAAQFVAAKLQEAGLEQTTLQEFSFRESSGTNVEASLPGRSDRLLIVATHHDSRKDGDGSDRSRSLSLLIEIGRQARLLRPARTWILASFDGGESLGEGFDHYLEGLGKNRALVDGVVLLDASTVADPKNRPALIAPACAGGPSSAARGIADWSLVSAALRGVPAAADFSFDDPGISLLTQPFIRAFRTDCGRIAARALAAGIGVIEVSDTSYSRSFLAPEPTPGTGDAPGLDQASRRLGEVAFAAIRGIDAAPLPTRDSDSWIVVGRTVWPGWAVFILGLATLAPALFVLRAQSRALWIRAAYSVVFTLVLYAEPEVAVFAGALPNLLPPSVPRALLLPALAPFALLVAAGGLGFIRGQVTGTWLPAWVWAGLLIGFALLYWSGGGKRKRPSRTKKERS